MSNARFLRCVSTLFGLAGLGCASSADSPAAGLGGGDGAETVEVDPMAPANAKTSEPPQLRATSTFYAPEDTGTASAEDELTQVEAANPFVVASYDPLSTFAADVDTASYDLFRRDLLAGTLPDPASVRLEEYVNYFAYDYPAPAHDAQEPFSISLAAAPNVVDRETVLLRIGIQGKDAPPEASAKKPANLVFLIDVSGSMSSAAKLPLVQQVLLEVLDVLEPEDTISRVPEA